MNDLTIHIDYYPLDGRWKGDGEGWMVALPHQCDEWAITEKDEYATHSEAISALKRFMSETWKALLFLENQPAKPEKRVKWGSGECPEETGATLKEIRVAAWELVNALVAAIERTKEER